MLALGSVQEVIERQIKAGKVEFDIPGKSFFPIFSVAVNNFIEFGADAFHGWKKYRTLPISSSINKYSTF